MDLIYGVGVTGLGWNRPVSE